MTPPPTPNVPGWEWLPDREAWEAWSISQFQEWKPLEPVAYPVGGLITTDVYGEATALYITTSDHAAMGVGFASVGECPSCHGEINEIWKGVDPMHLPIVAKCPVCNGTGKATP